MPGQSRFVHLGINHQRVPWEIVRKGVEDYLNRVAEDWYRYGPQNYVVWTNADLASLSQSIAAQPGLQSIYVLATEFDPAVLHTNGWMPQQFWDWLHKPRYGFRIPPGLFPPLSSKR